MPRSYWGILEGDRVRWTGPAPAEHGPVEVSVTVVGPAISPTTPSGNGDAERGRRMAAALAALSHSRTFADPSAWQREARSDRALPGCEGDETSPAPDAP